MYLLPMSVTTFLRVTTDASPIRLDVTLNKDGDYIYTSKMRLFSLITLIFKVLKTL